MSTRNSKTTGSGGNVVKKGPQTIPKQPFQQRLVNAAADLAWKVKQRGVRERSEEEDAGSTLKPSQWSSSQQETACQQTLLLAPSACIEIIGSTTYHYQQFLSV
jgi:hypothetical protein